MIFQQKGRWDGSYWTTKTHFLAHGRWWVWYFVPLWWVGHISSRCGQWDLFLPWVLGGTHFVPGCCRFSSIKWPRFYPTLQGLFGSLCLSRTTCVQAYWPMLAHLGLGSGLRTVLVRISLHFNYLWNGVSNGLCCLCKTGAVGEVRPVKGLELFLSELRPRGPDTHNEQGNALFCCHVVWVLTIIPVCTSPGKGIVCCHLVSI